MLIWIVLSVGWIAADRGIRDGDEEGHVGAAELYLSDLDQADVGALVSKAWLGEGMGEYPQGFASITAVWWWLQDGGLPGRPAVRAICLLGLLLAAWSTGRLARRHAPPERADLAELTATIGVLMLPLANGLSRHFMPEGLLIGALALALLAAVRATERPTVGRLLVFGLAVGAGILIKQTFVLVGAVPLAALLIGLRRAGWHRVLGVCVVTAATAGPWVGGRLSGQADYLSQSAAGQGDANLISHLIYYPWTMGWLGLGPVLALATIASLAMLLKSGQRRAIGLGALWLLGGLVILTLVPKKYPRLIAPLLPAVALWWAAAVVRTRRPTQWLGAFGALAAAWLTIASIHQLPIQVAPAGVDPGCPQQWLRPPQPSDLGLSAIAAAMPETARSQPTVIEVIGSPEIPCSVQTTYTWHRHLRPYLSRSGYEAQVHTEPQSSADLIIDWTEGPGERIDIPALHSGFWIRPGVLR